MDPIGTGQGIGRGVQTSYYETTGAYNNARATGQNFFSATSQAFGVGVGTVVGLRQIDAYFQGTDAVTLQAVDQEFLGAGGQQLFFGISQFTGSVAGFAQAGQFGGRLLTHADDVATMGVNVDLFYKRDWTEAQRAAARQKAAALTNAPTVVVRNPARSGTSAASRYRQAGGEIPPRFDIDHIIDLQLGGVDDILNLSPLDLSVNRSLGAQIRHRVSGLPEGTPVNRFNIQDRQ